MNDNENDKIKMVADEIMLYINHLGSGSNDNEKSKDVAFSFGTPTDVKYTVAEDGLINVDLDFSSVTWNYDYDNEVKEDINLDNEKYNPTATWKWMDGKRQFDFENKLDNNIVDYSKLKEILSEKYEVDFNLLYDKKIYSETKWNGSDGKEAKHRVVYYVINSHMYLSGRPRELEEEHSPQL